MPTQTNLNVSPYYDDFDPENDQTTEEYREDLIEMTLEELVEETSTGEGYTLDEWMENWG